ncbi:protein disulfide-isomerase A4-like [Gordionus sp. m RMFG-2023]|uniref:protein disulfide-isomerase A4-like n=1 Tax=Gordionus sp. m RMFG-2023 TaxID=3053472 RepID=UPI0031FBFFD0
MSNVLQPDWKPEANPVLILTDENFDSFVPKYKLILIEFYAPWCGHCKALEPHYKSAAKELNQISDLDEHDFIKLAKIDATQNKNITSKYEVKGYPTLKIFRRGVAYEYNGPRDSSENIVKYMLNQMGDGSKEFENLKQMRNIMAPEEVTFIGFFESREDAKYHVYLDACSSLRDDFTFLHTFNQEVMMSTRVPNNTILLLQPEKFQSKYESLRFVFPEDDEVTSQTLKSFGEKWRRPLVGQMTKANRQFLFLTLPLCVVFYGIDWSFDHIQNTQYWRAKVLEVAKDFHPRITFAIADETEFQDELKKLQLDESGEEVNAGCYTQSKRFRMDPEEFEVDNYRSFIKEFQDDNLKPIVWSQPAPAVTANAQANVKTLVAHNLPNVFTDTGNREKLILIEFYAPWCGHCKKLEPIYNKLGKKYLEENRIIIAKIDATANDIDKDIIQITGFPTLVLFKPPHINKVPVIYQGKREFDSLVEFVEAHLVNLTTSIDEPKMERIEL